MKRRSMVVLILALGAISVATQGQRDERWELLIHMEGNTQVYDLADIDSLSFRRVQIPAVCCVGYDCSILSEDECVLLGGGFHPEWIDCHPNPCLPPAEAVCCIDGDNCIMASQEDCNSTGGIWHPWWFSCDPNPCWPGMIFVPAGTFVMGDGEAYCGVHEREVTLTRDFFLGQHEVTNQEYIEALQWAYDSGYVTIASPPLPCA